MGGQPSSIEILVRLAMKKELSKSEMDAASREPTSVPCRR